MSGTLIEVPEFRFPEVLDSTLLNSWRNCQTQGRYSGFFRLKPVGLSIDLHAGGAFARGLETARRAFYAQGKSERDAVALGLEALMKSYGDPTLIKDTPKTWDRMLGALEAYFGQYPLESDSIKPACYSGKWAIEFSFAMPLDMWGFYHPVTHNPLILAGRTDMIGTFRSSDFVVDEKTTKQLGESWGSKWDLRAQFLCYMWAAREYGFNIAGTVVRGVAIRKTGYDFAEALLRRNDALIDRWVWQTKRSVQEMFDCWNSGQFGFNLGEACESYGGCPFKQLCLSSNPEPHIRTDYEENTWSPLGGGNNE